MIVGLTIGFVAGVYLMAFVAERKHKQQRVAAYTQGRTDCGEEIILRMQQKKEGATWQGQSNN